MLLTRVEYLKHGAIKNFCIVDAAMTELLRPAIYQAYHAIHEVVLSPERQADVYDVVGPVCETGDWLGQERKLSIQQGQLLAIGSTGAYGFAMSSNYNSRPRPAEIIVDGQQVHVIRERETVQALYASERLMPETTSTLKN